MKQIFILTTIFLLFLTLKSQGQITTFNKRLSLDKAAVRGTSLVTTDSCFYISGVVVDTFSNYTAGALFASFDWEGNELFHKSLYDTTQRHATWFPNMQILEDGNLAVVGYTEGIGRINPALIKYTPQGDTLFVQEYDTPFNYSSNKFYRLDDMALTSDDGFIIGGFGASGFNREGMVLLKADALGNKEWERTYDSVTASERINSILVDTDGGYIISAYIHNFYIADNNYFGFVRIFKTDNLGNIIWTVDYQDPDYEFMDRCRGMYLNDDGSIVGISGVGIDEAPWASSPQVGWIPQVFKFNENRELEWAIDLVVVPSIFNHNILTQIIRLENNSGYIVVGDVNVAGSDIPLSEARKPGLIAKVSEDGVLKWQRYIHYVVSPSEQDNHIIYDVKEAPDGGLIMCGLAEENDPSYLEATGEASQQLWLVKTDKHGCLVPGCHLVNSVEQTENNITVQLYPNPTVDYLNIYCKQNDLPKDAQFQVIDLQGRIIDTFEHVYPDITHILSVSHLSTGTYILQYQEKGIVQYSEQFVVQR